MPFFSVIIPLYNKEDYIEATINSVLEQSFKDFEVIIVDDGSTDNSYQLVSQFKDHRICIIQQKNQGVSLTRNHGIHYANSKYIALLDADDLWKPNHLEVFYKSIQAFPDVDLYCNNYEINYNKKIIKPANHNFKDEQIPLIIDDFFKLNKSDSLIYTSCTCLRKTSLINLGMFKKQYDGAEDLDIWIKFAINHKMVYNPTVTMTYSRYISNSLSKSNLNLNQFRLFYSLKHNEKKYPHMKSFVDLKRYGLALRSKINGDNNIYFKTIKDIDFNNLSFKQKTLLKLPVSILKFLNHMRTLVLNNSIYLRLFK
ncbi:glycosyltransferase family 2 protein [Snuella lapsa]|uniref:Glycosyltransferase family 2 protein n=1 Tax=Snuella lapsa TaxID=870481 RepID=A0ABP6XN86_9FLAO